MKQRGEYKYGGQVFTFDKFVFFDKPNKKLVKCKDLTPARQHDGRNPRPKRHAQLHRPRAPHGRDERPLSCQSVGSGRDGARENHAAFRGFSSEQQAEIGGVFGEDGV